MIFIPVFLNDLKPYIKSSYRGDIELRDKYHINKYNLNDAVDITFKMIELTSKEVDMNCFAVCFDNGKIIGYLCYFKNNLYSFAINIKYRTKEILKLFWDRIVFVMKEGFVTALFPNNTRAINWLKKCGMSIVPDVDEDLITLIKTI